MWPLGTRATWQMALAWHAAVTLVCVLKSPSWADQIPIGYLTNLHGVHRNRLGLSISGAINYAVEQVNARPDLLPGHTLNLTYADTLGDTRTGTRHLTEMICRGLVAFFGPEDSCLVEASVAAAYNLPMISYKCTDEAVSDKTQFPNFARTYPPETQVTKSVVSLLLYHNWRKFSIVFSLDPAQTRIANSLQKVAEEEGLTVNHKLEFPSSLDTDRHVVTARIHNLLKTSEDETRVYVVLGSSGDLFLFLAAMKDFNMFSGSYAVIFIDLDFVFTDNSRFKYMWSNEQMWALLKEDDYHCSAGDLHSLRNLLVVRPSLPRAEFRGFSERVRLYNKRPPFHFSVPDFKINFKKHVSITAAYLYDSLLMYAGALNASIASNPHLPLQQILQNGSLIISHITNNTFRSVTGTTIKMDSNGDSEGNFSVLALQGGCSLSIHYKSTNHTMTCDKCLQTVGMFHASPYNIPVFEMNWNVSVGWIGGSVPKDEPECGYTGNLCTGPDLLQRDVVAGVLGVVLAFVSFVMLFSYRLWKEEREIVGLLWRIDAADLDEFKKPTRLPESPSKLSLVSTASMESRCMSQVFAITGRYKGLTVRIKNLKLNKKVEVSRSTMKEMRSMRDLRHQNINPFIGAVVASDCVKIVSDYCPRGSLPDILEGGDLNLGYMFIAELIHDLVKGMTYLHGSPLQVHGNLKSSNCVVTSRWVLKLTDFGLHDLRQACRKCTATEEYQFYQSQLWMAPEVLRVPELWPRGSQSADVFAFAVILREILSRDGPYGATCGEPKEIIERVKRGDDQPPFRPPLDDLNTPEDMPIEATKMVVECMQICWSENAVDRPAFTEIKRLLHRLRAGKSSNLVNSMMEKMEKYADNLEELVRERTQLLNEEKLKTEALLHRMLPRQVADSLIRGVPVQPETFDSVTIYFSDIVGFTAISASSTPLQVVEMLNDVYTLFDDIILGFDVYKVETIGDAYMVVSGVPKLNGFQHAGEIASMALRLLEAIQRHTVQHRPHEKLKLRIGIHTGPVVAGVVGLTMPRYCLFGDTVNTASRLESSGEQLRIHISDSCKRALDRMDIGSGGYVTERRGPVLMKGKGLMETHWLLAAGPGCVQPRRRNDLPSLPPLFQSTEPPSDGRSMALDGRTASGSSRSSLKTKLRTRSLEALQQRSHAPASSSLSVDNCIAASPLPACNNVSSVDSEQDEPDERIDLLEDRGGARLNWHDQLRRESSARAAAEDDDEAGEMLRSNSDAQPAMKSWFSRMFSSGGGSDVRHHPLLPQHHHSRHQYYRSRSSTSGSEPTPAPFNGNKVTYNGAAATQSTNTIV